MTKKVKNILFLTLLLCVFVISLVCINVRVKEEQGSNEVNGVIEQEEKLTGVIYFTNESSFREEMSSEDLELFRKSIPKSVVEKYGELIFDSCNHGNISAHNDRYLITFSKFDDQYNITEYER